MELMKGDSKSWAWTKEADTAFKDLKERFPTAPVLAHFDPL